MASCFMNETLPVDQWNTNTLDRILKNGDWLYGNWRITETYPLARDLGKQYWIDGLHYNVNIGDSYYGTVYNEEGLFMPFEEALKSVDKYSILTLGSSTPAYSCCVIKQGGAVFIFDSHSRNMDGMGCADGKATLTSHLTDMVPIFVKNLTNSLAIADQYELTPFSVTSIPEPTSLIPPTDPVESLLLCQESDDFDSDSSSDVPLAAVKHLADLVNQQRSVSSKTEAHGQDGEPDERISKRKAQTYLREFFVAEFSDEDRYGHISDSDGDGDETYSPPKVKKTKLYDVEQFTTPPSTRPIPILQMGPEDAISSTPISFSDSNVKVNSLITLSPLQSPGSVVESPSHPQTSAPCDTPRGRRRQRQPDNWGFNVAKRKRNLGQEYKSRTGKPVRARVIKPGCGEGCRFKCQTNIISSHREEIFHDFWQLGCLTRQRDFFIKKCKRNRKEKNQTKSQIKKKTVFTLVL